MRRVSARSRVKQADLDAGARQDGLASVEREELARLRRENRRLREDVDWGPGPCWWPCYADDVRAPSL